MYKVYILKSISKSRYYIGHAEDINSRLEKHNKGHIKSTKYGCPWKVVYLEEYESRSEANRREIEIKSYKGGIKFKKLLGLSWRDGRVA
jgi:putative endonuclease